MWWRLLCVVAAMCFVGCVWCRLCVVAAMCGGGCCVWWQLCVVSAVCGGGCVWCRLCVVAAVYGGSCVWWRLCVVAAVCGGSKTWIISNERQTLFPLKLRGTVYITYARPAIQYRSEVQCLQNQNDIWILPRTTIYGKNSVQYTAPKQRKSSA